jgi:HEAT repeat protein
MKRLGLFRRSALLVVPFITLSLSAQVALLKDPDPKERAKAADKVGKEGTSDDIPALAELLDDPVTDVRAEAVGAILRLDTQHSLVPLMRATRDSTPEIQIMATDGLVNFYYPGYVKTGWTAALKSLGSNIKGRFSEPEPKVVDPYMQSQVSRDVVRAMGRLITGGTSTESRANAARAIGVLRGKEGMPQLVEGLRARESTIIIECVRTIRKIGDKGVGPDMVFLLRDLDEDVQFETARTMGQLQVKEGIPELLNLVERNKEKKIRREALIAVAKMRDQEQRPLFQRYLEDKDKQLRAAAAEGLGRLGNQEDLQSILDAFSREKSESARLSMAFGAVGLGDTSFLTYLYDGLNSSFHRLEARPFLTELSRDAGILQQLYKPLATGSNDQKKHIAYVISINGNKESMAHLEKLTHDSDTDVAREAIRALKNLQARLL